MPDVLPNHAKLWQQTLGWQPSEAQQALFQQFYEQIVAGNQQLNITRIITPEDFWEKHLWDSMSGLSPWLCDRTAADLDPQESIELAPSEDPEETDQDIPIRIIDIGTGGGMPGIPAAIALAPLFPKIDLTLLDATRKKIQFLEALCANMQIPATCIAERAEALARQPIHREQYDLALVRAVGSAATCTEYALPFLKLGGQAVLFRGQWSTDDTEALMPVVDLLGGELTDVQSWQTPLSQSQRHCIFIHKNAPTPKDFPRAVGVPGKKPLT
ncbi:MAG: 16S rRNA (guanine527-N7)-methyltransferase GidB [Phormidesmis priestleyi Ana]|uniref:Ribosomal RNA small subunit methyltransferase G n=1 Tax=Phormidesmis priestleyi Ana TaxID=1666911 RepID=A0A0N8KNM8_9CYAN|nr:MAG: 16S rRNA (guanine527-N7)-methyltransferase GidB [Phormidesmis priestleyi Ana]